MTEKRFEGLVEKNELERIKEVATQKPDKPKPKSKWKHQHEQLVSAMRAVKGETQEVKTTVDPSLVPCPHCHRKFNATSAERHIKICQKVFNSSGSKKDVKRRGKR